MTFRFKYKPKRLSVKINRCSFCELDINTHQWKGGCNCIPLNADGKKEQRNPLNLDY